MYKCVYVYRCLCDNKSKVSIKYEIVFSLFLSKQHFKHFPMRTLLKDNLNQTIKSQLHELPQTHIPIHIPILILIPINFMITNSCRH